MSLGWGVEIEVVGEYKVKCLGGIWCLDLEFGIWRG